MVLTGLKLSPLHKSLQKPQIQNVSSEYLKHKTAGKPYGVESIGNCARKSKKHYYHFISRTVRAFSMTSDDVLSVRAIISSVSL